MSSRLIVAASAVSLIAVACASQESPAAADGTWVGTITSEGNITTVVNESGSVWGGTAKLVEEASIGVDAGDDAYMFGDIEGVAIAGDRIFVLDRTVSKVRVYDRDGNHLHDMGREGQGPGEFTNPYLLEVSRGGRVFVRTHLGLVEFDADGNHVRTLTEDGGIVLQMVVGEDGTLYMPVSWAGPTPMEMGSGHLAIAPDGTRGERVERPSLVDRQPWALMARGANSSRQQSVPFAPATVWTRARNGGVIQGASNAYRIDVRDREGSVLRIERPIDGIAVEDAERIWQETMTELIMRRIQPDWTWNDNPIPPTKPFFARFYTDHDGVLWVRRIIRTESVTDCDLTPVTALEEQRPPRPCFRDIQGFDVFGADGRYRGTVELPPVTRREEPAINGNEVVLAVEDEAGTIMVKRYRLVLPGEE